MNNIEEIYTQDKHETQLMIHGLIQKSISPLNKWLKREKNTEDEGRRKLK